jgi:HEAT repeat protein
MFRHLFLFASVVMSLGTTPKRGECASPFKGTDYPTVRKRTAFFAERFNAKNPATRRQLLDELSYSYAVPDADYVAYLKHLLRDSDSSIRGSALQTLYNLWVPIQPKELPRRFAVGFGFRRQIDLDDAATIPALMKECQWNTEQAGDAAFVLGLLQHKPAIPVLKQMTKDEGFVSCYAAARALLACGDRDSARPVFEKMVRSQLSPYVTPPTVQIKPAGGMAQWQTEVIVSGPLPVPHYATLACRAMIELSPKDKPRRLKDLITLLDYLERSRDPNDRTHVPYVRELLALFAGEYFVSHAEAQQWYVATYEKKDGVRVRKAPAAIKAEDCSSVAARVVFFEDRINAKDPSIRRDLLWEISHVSAVPDAGYVRLLKRLLHDPNPEVRGESLNELHGLWVPIDLQDVPQKFTGCVRWQLIDRDKPSTIPDLLRACQEPEAEAGYAAYVLGLLHEKSALPTLKKLAKHESIFVRCSAARALYDCGDRQGSQEIFEEIIRSQLALYASPPPQPRAEGKEKTPGRPMMPSYAIQACEGLTKLGPKEKQMGIDKLIALLNFLERSDDVNDEAILPNAKRTLAFAAGRYLDSATEARQWYNERYVADKSKRRSSP